jgi:hypothetical protein
MTIFLINNKAMEPNALPDRSVQFCTMRRLQVTRVLFREAQDLGRSVEQLRICKAATDL